MPMTRVFKSGNSQAVRIPVELAFEDISQDLTITRLGDVITITPAKASLAQAVAALRELGRPPAMARCEAIELPVRAWD